MTAATSSPSGRRAAATWIGATGAFLLVAAATVFVAVRWDRLPDSAKLALVGGLTGAVLVGGRAVRRTLPATGDVLFHLGAFLVPVDLAGACLRVHVGWRATLLAEGIVCVATFTALAVATRSAVLAKASVASVVVLAAGVAGVSPVPATLLLAMAAVVAELAAGDRHRDTALGRAAATWAALAGLAPALGAAAGVLLRGSSLHLGAGTLAELGLSGDAQQAVAAVSGLLAAFVLARQAGARRDIRLAYLALASVALGFGTSVTATHLRGSLQLLGLAGTFVVVEVIALTFFDDDFRGRPLAGVASCAEALATPAVVAAGVALAFAPLLDPLRRTSWLHLHGDVTLAATMGLLALGWLAGDVRRAQPAEGGMGRTLLNGTGWTAGSVSLALCVAAAVEVGTASGLATAVALVAVAAALVATRRAGAAGLATALVPWAVVAGATHPAAVPGVGAIGALVLAVAAGRIEGRTEGRGEDRARAVPVAVVATGVAVVGSLLGADFLGSAGSLAVAGGAAWVLAAVLDEVGGGRLGDVARVGMLVPAGLAATLAPALAVGPLAAVAALYAIDAVRQDRPGVAVGAAVVVQPLVVRLAEANGVRGPWAGFGLCVCAVVWAGLAAAVDDRWRAPFLAAAGTGLAAGLALAHGDGRALSDSFLLAGGVGMAAGLWLRQPALGYAGGAVVTAGLAGHLILWGVTASEPFVAPVALQLLVAGWQAQRRHRTSSWVAYAPAVVLLGGSALAERIGGGAGWHAVVAGGVGVAAVAVGGWHRLAGPMVAGTALLVVLAVEESLSALAGVPTWAWLGLGGSVLLGTAVLLERTDASPLEAGRRVVEVLGERFG